MEDDAECVPLAGTHFAHPVAVLDAIEAAGSANGAVAHRKYHSIALAQWNDRRARLAAGSLFGEDEFTA